jgi:hypothetical protein
MRIIQVKKVTTKLSLQKPVEGKKQVRNKPGGSQSQAAARQQRLRSRLQNQSQAAAHIACNSTAAWRKSKEKA